MFDPYCESLTHADVWVRLLRFPIELASFVPICKLFEANKVGKLLKLDICTEEKFKIKFARACVSVNVTLPLVSYVETARVGGLNDAFVVWYEDFPIGCSCCGSPSHLIDICPLLSLPKRETKIFIKKDPKIIQLSESILARASWVASHGITAETADVIHAPMRTVPKTKAKALPKKVSQTATQKKNKQNVHSKTPKKDIPLSKGVTIKEPSINMAKGLDSRPVSNEKGKGKMVADSNLAVVLDSSDFIAANTGQLAIVYAPVTSVLGCGFSASKADCAISLALCDLDSNPGPLAIVPLSKTTDCSTGIIVSNPFSLLGEGLDTDNVAHESNLADLVYEEDDLLDDEDILEGSFNSLNSSSSFIQKIGVLEMKSDRCNSVSKESSSSKRKMDDLEEVDSASASSKRSRA